MKIVVITQARMGSTRLPGKVSKMIQGKTLLQIHVERLLRSALVSDLIIATTTNSEDEAIISQANSLGVHSYRGAQDDVLDRYYQAARPLNPDYVVRVTSDCPLIDAELMDEIINSTIVGNWDYCSNTLHPSFPDGQDIEVFKMSSLEKAWNEAVLQSEREHVTPYIKKNSTFHGKLLFKSDNFVSQKDFSHIRMTVDEAVDFEIIKILIEQLGMENTWMNYAEFLDNNIEIRSLNSDIIRDAGYSKSLKNDKNVK